MKNLYIPKGQALNYDTLETEHLVVNGILNVAHGLKARTISGDGLVLAGTVSADDIRVRELEAASVYCLRLAAKRVQAAEVFASESAAVSCYLCADYVSRSLWASMTTPREREVLDAEYRQVQEEPSAGKTEDPRDEELERIISIFKLLRNSGYTLKVIPGTPEDNAPAFNFLAERANLPAA